MLYTAIRNIRRLLATYRRYDNSFLVVLLRNTRDYIDETLMEYERTDPNERNKRGN